MISPQDINLEGLESFIVCPDCWGETIKREHPHGNYYCVNCKAISEGAISAKHLQQYLADLFNKIQGEIGDNIKFYQDEIKKLRENPDSKYKMLKIEGYHAKIVALINVNQIIQNNIEVKK